MKLKLQSLWNRAGKPERAFALLLVLYLILRAAWRDSVLETLVAFATYVIGAWVALRLLRIGLRKLTWRLRNRLMVAYLFIAVLPILLILTLVGLGGYMLATEVAVYMVRSELDRRVASLESAAEVLAGPGTPHPMPFYNEPPKRLRSAFPGLLLSWRKRGRFGAGPKTPRSARRSICR